MPDSASGFRAIAFSMRRHGVSLGAGVRSPRLLLLALPDAGKVMKIVAHPADRCNAVQLEY